MVDFFEEGVLQKICALLTRKPGLYQSKIAELLNLKIADVERYLHHLEEKRVIVVSKEAGYDRFYIAQKKGKTRDKRTVDTRKIIFDLIETNPGLHLSKIAEKLDMSIPLTNYHLVSMEQEGVISVVRDDKGYYKRYYLADVGLKSDEKQILELLRKKILLKIVMLLLKNSTMQHKQILEYFDISSSTLSYHLTKLVENGIVDVHPHGREKGYSLKNREEIIRILKKYELNIELNLTVEGFKDMWDDLSYHDSLE